MKKSLLNLEYMYNLTSERKRDVKLAGFKNNCSFMLYPGEIVEDIGTNRRDDRFGMLLGFYKNTGLGWIVYVMWYDS